MAEQVQPTTPQSAPLAPTAQTGLARWLWPALGAAVVLALPALIGLLPGISVNYIIYVVNLGLVFAVVAIGLNLLTGFAGQISIGHAGFMALGAYTSGLLVTNFGVPFLLALLIAGLLSGVIGLGLGLVALRLSGPYLAVATLGFGVAVSQLMVRYDHLTGGTAGLKVARASIGPLRFDTDVSFYYLAVVAVALVMWLVRNLTRARTGRAFIAVRDNERAAQALGVSLRRYKTLAFTISAFLTGVAGSLFAHQVGFVAPENFTLLLSIQLLTMIVVGGLASIGGSVAGALAITALPIWLATIPGVPKNLPMVLFGAFMIFVMVFYPLGLAGVWQALQVRIKKGTVGTRGN